MNKKWMIFLLGAAAVLAAAGLLFWRQSSRLEMDFSYSGEAFGNPLMGYAPSAWHDEVAEDVTLLYMDTPGGSWNLRKGCSTGQA